LKYFGSSKAKRPQLGLSSSKFLFKYLALVVFILLLLFRTTSLTSWMISFVFVLFASFLFGAYLQYRFQHILVSINVPRLIHYGTVSQTIIIATRSGKFYYFYRDLVGSLPDQTWRMIRFDNELLVNRCTL